MELLQEQQNINNIFKVEEKYTIFGISSFLATTWKIEAICTGKTTEETPIFKFKGKRKEKIFNDIKECAIFLGWDIGLIADSDTNRFNGNACFNFIGSKDYVKNFIEKNQINPLFQKQKNRVVAVERTPLNESEKVVYPELDTGQHAVITRILKNGN